MIRLNVSRTSVSFLCLLALGLAGCASPSSGGTTAQDVSSEMATVAADLTLAQNSSLQTNFVDESTVATESSTTTSSSNGESRSTQSSAPTLTITTTHSVPTPTSGQTQFQDGDVVKVVRTWTNAEGETVVDTVIRPKIPSAQLDYSLSSYTPVAGSSGISLTGISATVTASVWTLNGTETKTVNNIPFAQQTLSMVYKWGSALPTPRAQLVSVTRGGENINLYTTRVKLTSTIYYAYDTSTAKDMEFLRVLDFIGASSELQRQVYAWGITPSTSMGIPALYDSSVTGGSTTATALTFTPALSPESGRTTVSLWYYSNQSVALSTYTPSYTGTSLATYPDFDVSHWLGSVLQESGPRIADWYKPIPNATSGAFVGNYVRRNEHTYYTGGSTNKIYSLTDGVTLLNTVGTLIYQTAGNGTVTTTKKFSDGITSTVTITPTDDSNGNITGYVITRGSTTYTIVYTKDTTGDLTSISVTNSTTSKTKTYTNTSGTWS